MSLILLTRNQDLHPQAVYLWPFPSQNSSAPFCISNKFPCHCHVQAEEESNMLNLQSMPKITPCVIVSQRKAIVCPWEEAGSQGLPADSLKSLTPTKHTFSRDRLFYYFFFYMCILVTSMQFVPQFIHLKFLCWTFDLCRLWRPLWTKQSLMIGKHVAHQVLLHWDINETISIMLLITRGSRHKE